MVIIFILLYVYSFRKDFVVYQDVNAEPTKVTDNDFKDKVSIIIVVSLLNILVSRPQCLCPVVSSLRNRPFLLSPRRMGCFVCASTTEIPYR